MKHFFIGIFLFFLMVAYSFAAKVDTVEVFSAAMNKKIKTVVISPEQKTETPIPTLYLLHGAGGDYATWVTRVPQIKSLVDQYNYRIVCPDGGSTSWYWDVQGDNDYQYETFVGKELVSFVEANYRVCKDKNARAITGLSMGGHGALYIAIRSQDVFGAAGSTSGGVDIRPFSNNWQIAKRLGAYKDNSTKWNEHTVMEMLHLIQRDSLRLFIDCGTGDFFYEINKELHKRMSYMNIAHTFVTMPGKHDYAYWGKSILLQMAFFDDFFRNQ